MHSDDHILTYHEDVDRFREALSFTESNTGFSARLVEKDYYCSILLHDLAPAFQQGLLFQGGTCLSKVYTNFYRLSEDLDFALATEINARRSDRRTKIGPLRDHLVELPARVPCFHVAIPLQGSNFSKQYVGRYAYRSLVTGQDEFIKVEIAIREPTLDPVEQRFARTVLTDPFRNEPVLGPIAVSVLSIHETYAEKFRAALTRREPAIRDFYDVDYAVQTHTLEPTDGRLLELVRQKLGVPGNDPIDVSDAKLITLTRQLDAQLKPVLQTANYVSFDLPRAFGMIRQLAGML